MRLNDDLTQPVLVRGSQQAWIGSPAGGVDRRMLFRIGKEKARATSVVRYAPGSRFPAHVHTGGEEFFVLEGVFQDEAGDYPAGSYIRNPPGTAHAPAAKDGATIFVRLWQFRTDDRTQLVQRPGDGRPVEARLGCTMARILFEDGLEEVRLETWEAHVSVAVENPAGLEFLVIAGGLVVNGQTMIAQDWGRLPTGTALSAKVGDQGASLWMRFGPLVHSDVCVIEIDAQ